MSSRRVVVLALVGSAFAVICSLWLATSWRESTAEPLAASDAPPIVEQAAEPETVAAPPSAPSTAQEIRVAVSESSPAPAATELPAAGLVVEVPRAEVGSWTVRISDGVEVVPCAELLLRRQAFEELLRADSAGRLEAAIAESDRVTLRIPGAASLELPARVDPRGSLGPSLRVELESVILFAAPAAGDWTLVSTAARVDSRSGRLLPALMGWPCGADRMVFPVPGRTPDVTPGDRDRIVFVAREGGQRAGEIEIPWPCWASDGVHSLMRSSPSTASLRVNLRSRERSEAPGALQLTLKAASAPRTSPALAVEFAQLGSAVDFDDLEPQTVKLYVRGERVGLTQRTVELAPGANEIELLLTLEPAPLTFEVEVHSRGGELDENLFVSALPSRPGPPAADVPLNVRRDEFGQEQGRASLALAAGEWRLRLYSASTGVTYVADHLVRAEDGRARLDVDEPVRLIEIYLAEDSKPTGLDFWVDATGEGLRRTAVGAQPGGMVARVPASAGAVTWVLVDERGLYQHGQFADLRSVQRSDGEHVYVLSPALNRSTARAVHLTAAERGVEAVLEGRRSDRLGYVFIEGDLGTEVSVEVGGRPQTVHSRATRPWGMTLSLSP